MTKGQFTPVSTEDSEQTRKGITRIKKTAIVVVVIVLVILVIAVTAAVVLNSMNAADDSSDSSMSFEPNIDHMVVFQQGVLSSADKYITRLHLLEDDYESESQIGENALDCSEFAVKQPGKFCRFDLDSLGNECVREKTYGFDEGRPCIFLSLHTKEDLVPELSFNSSMPSEVRERFQDGYIPVSCEGVTEADEDNLITGKDVHISYWPPAGFPVYFFPTPDLEGSLPPLVAVQFHHPAYGATINVECRVWADNMDASVQFKLLVN